MTLDLLPKLEGAVTTVGQSIGLQLSFLRAGEDQKNLGFQNLIPLTMNVGLATGEVFHETASTC